MKHYKAIFFDWDGTAVLSRKAPVEDAVNAMRPLLDKGVKLCIVSGTTYEKIAGGKLHSYFTPKQLENLYLGLGRGAFDYGYNTAGHSGFAYFDGTPGVKYRVTLKAYASNSSGSDTGYGTSQSVTCQ